MAERLIRLSASAAVKEKRLQSLLGGRDPTERCLPEAIEDAQVLGSLELAGISPTAGEVAAARRGEGGRAEIAGLIRAYRAVSRDAPFSVQAVLAWHADVSGTSAGFRVEDRQRPGGPAPAPAIFVGSRLAILEEWLNADSIRELKPAQVGALTMARLMEILPFDTANGRVARLAASHLMVRAGGRPPILVGTDAPRLGETLTAAFQLATAPLAALLEEASERSLDVMIAALERQSG